MMVRLSVCTFVFQRRQDGALSLATHSSVEPLSKQLLRCFCELWMGREQVWPSEACLVDWLTVTCWHALGCCCVKASKECRRESVVWLSKILNVFWYNCFKSIWKLSMIWENQFFCHSYLLYPLCRDYTLPVSYPSSIKFTVTSSHLTRCKESNLYFFFISLHPLFCLVH